LFESPDYKATDVMGVADKNACAVSIAQAFKNFNFIKLHLLFPVLVPGGQQLQKK
jgi:hypothetical protein